MMNEQQRVVDPYAGATATLMAAGVPEPWADAVQACLALDPDARPRDVAAVRAKLPRDEASKAC